MIIRRCHSKGIKILEVEETEDNIRKVLTKSCLLILPKMYRNMIVQFTHELKAEVVDLLNYNQYEVWAVK